MRLARKTLTLSCLIPAVLARDCLVFVKDRPVSGLGVFVFEFLGSLFSSFWVLRFRDLGASFSRFGYFVLRSSFLESFVFETTKHFRGSVATNQTTADVKERNHRITKSTTAATWDYQYFACALVGV